MQVYHEEFGEGQILASTEQFDEAGNITSADVMFEHGVEMGMSAHDLQELSKEMMGSYVKAKKAAIPYQATAPGIKLAQKKMAKEEVEELDELSKETLGKYINKAADRMSTQGVTAGLKIAADEKSSKNFKNIAKRQSGIDTAVKKLTKTDEALEPWMGKDMDTPAYLRKAKQKEAEDAGKGGGAAVRTAKNEEVELAEMEKDPKTPAFDPARSGPGALGRPITKNRMARTSAKLFNTAMDKHSKSMKEEKQHIEVIDASGQKRKVPVTADKAFAAVAHYRKQPGIKSARIVSEAPEIQEAIEVETVKHPIGQRPKGPGWVLKSAGEQTGKDHNVWQRKTKRLGEAAEVCTLGKESTGKTATTVAPTKKFGKPQPTNKGEVAEELTAAQKKHIDQNKNGKIDADDFEKLRGEDEPPFDKPYHVSKGTPSKSHRQKLARSGIPESVESMTEETKTTPHNVTPASADLRNVAVENTIRQIMSQNIDLRQEAKERDFNSRNNK